MKGKKVLIVEDNDLNRKLFENLIGQYWNYQSVTNGLEAIDLLEKEIFDLILMDIQMPKMDGITAMKKIRQLELCICPIIAVSAFAEESNRKEFLVMGFDDFLTKPIRPKAFLETLKTYLNHEQIVSSDPIQLDSALLLDKEILLQLLKYNAKEKVVGIMNDFIVEMDHILQNSQQAIKSQDQGLLIENIHTLKGNSGTLGANSIYKLASELEVQVKKINWPEVVDLFAKLKTEKESLENYIKEEAIFEL